MTGLNDHLEEVRPNTREDFRETLKTRERMKNRVVLQVQIKHEREGSGTLTSQEVPRDQGKTRLTIYLWL